MILKHASDVPAVPMTKPGFSGMQARFLLTADDGCPRYAMRLMEFAPGGHCSFHNHKEEHEIYFLEGEGILKTGTDRVRGPCWRCSSAHAVRISPDPEHRHQHAEDDLHGPAVTRKDW